MAVELSVGEVAKRSGVAVSALHFYERKGLIRSHRSGGNQRRYDRDVLRRLAQRMRERYARVRALAVERKLPLRQAAMMLSVRTVAEAVMARGLLP